MSNVLIVWLKVLLYLHLITAHVDYRLSEISSEKDYMRKTRTGHI